ncbi:hypothetical protein BpHYR1_033007 [Brachionus plicatilis]|uniref:Uncharacterized protein n=1 Tax=Brachionus plicatilis TaxID=10195 RepID=A0A3M7REC3_BRAPC|nr:hypothetical protein BpHYR1_033007 [Brachionus plicatilis]
MLLNNKINNFEKKNFQLIFFCCLLIFKKFINENKLDITCKQNVFTVYKKFFNSMRERQGLGDMRDFFNNKE